MTWFCHYGLRTALTRWLAIVLCCSAAGWPGVRLPAAEQDTGPSTEQRFPELVVPEGFRATLFACDPLVEYPSVIALGPRTGSLFVAQDYLTGLGVEIVRRDEVRLVADTDHDGYADQSTVYATGFHSIQGLAYQAGTVFVMHAPLLTALRDVDGDNVADERRDLLDGLGLLPEQNPTRLHCANGVAVGHDGWLYLAMGDNGTNVLRPEGDRLILNGGGILRCRTDGSDLHVFATGLRNIYDVALDEELNVFVRDNENDGGDYMIRVCHSFFGADHGYPYLYYERPEEALRPLADLGRGSSAGGVCYLETAFPPEYQGNLFFCEWGRAVVRYRRAPAGSSFAAMQEIEFAWGPAGDPYGFKPTDIIADYDGSLVISDWCDGQRPKRGRARIYRIAPIGHGESAASREEPPHRSELERWIAELAAPGYHQRVAAQLALQADDDGRDAVAQRLAAGQLGVLARFHAIWLLSRGEPATGMADLWALAERDEDPRVRAQAIRAITDLSDPVLLSDRLDAGAGDSATAARLAQLAEVAVKADPRVQREVVVALGRLRWSESPAWLQAHLTAPDPGLAHAAQQTLRRCGNWSAVLALLDQNDNPPVRAIALRALADQAELVVVDGLIARLATESAPSRRLEYATALARVCRRPGAWTYWGYRPGPRPANTESWDGTQPIAAALDRVLLDADRDVRLAALRGMQREQVPIQLTTLEKWLREERARERVESILNSLATFPAAATRDLLAGVVREPGHDETQRRQALHLLLKDLAESDQGLLLELAREAEDSPVLAILLRELGPRPQLASEELLLHKLTSPVAEVRAASVASLAALDKRTAVRFLPDLLNDSDAGVRRAAAAAAGVLEASAAIPLVLERSRDPDPLVRAASLESLRQLKVPEAVSAAEAALDHPATQRMALDYLRDFGGPDQRAAVTTAAANRSVDVLAAIVRALDHWQRRVPAESEPYRELEQAVAQLHGDSGVLLRWRTVPALADEQIEPFVKRLTPGDVQNGASLAQAAALLAADDSRIVLHKGEAAAGTQTLTYADLQLTAPARLQFLAACNVPWRVWLNGTLVHRRDAPAAFQADSERFEAELPAGTSRVVVALPAADAATIQFRFRRISSSADHERLTRLVLQDKGNVDRGRELFANAEKSQCVKCHRLNGQGGSIGPDLTGIGRRFSRIHLVESILEPSRTITPSYHSLTVALADGRVVHGVRIRETAETLTLGDEQGQTHELAKSEIDEQSVLSRSTMPDGLEKRFSDREFLDLVTFLLSQGGP